LLKKKFKRVFLALDTNNIKTAESLIKLLKNDLAGLKIGKELFSNYGPNIIKKFKKYKLPIFLDLKFHDIPTTVYKAVKVIDSLKVNYLSIHGLGGSSMIKAATKASNFTKILTVSLLSHHDQKSINEIGIKQSIQNEIKKLVLNALKNNTSGLILAPKDLEITKKIKKNILSGIAYVKSTFNNTIISIADLNGNVLAWSSAGQKGFKGSRKSTPYAAQVAADSVAVKALEFGMKTLSVEVKGPGSGRETALRALQARGFKIISIKDTTAMSHNGSRPPKRRRV